MNWKETKVRLRAGSVTWYQRCAPYQHYQRNIWPHCQEKGVTNRPTSLFILVDCKFSSCFVLPNQPLDYYSSSQSIYSTSILQSLEQVLTLTSPYSEWQSFSFWKTNTFSLGFRSTQPPLHSQCFHSPFYLWESWVHTYSKLHPDFPIKIIPFKDSQ